MSPSWAGFLQVALLVALLAAVHVPFGDYMARVFVAERHSRVERGMYRVMGVDLAADQTWGTYLRSVLAFSFVGVLFLFAFQRLQQHLVLNLGFPAVEPDQAWNTAASFVTNTNWQSYSGESTMGYLVQMAGLAVQNFVSAAVGLAVVVALIRGFTRSRTDRLGNFWVDLSRGTFRILLPLAFVFAVVLLAGGVIQNLDDVQVVTTLADGTQSIPGGAVASQEAIKELGTNGGGYFNANSAHPFENPTAWTNLLEVFLLLVIPFSLPRTFGRLVGDVRQGYAVVAAMVIIWVGSLAAMTAFEMQGDGAALQSAGAAMEGKETRFGIPASTLFATSTTLTSTGAVNSFHDSYTPLGGGVALVNMMTGEVAPGGVGSGMYGILVIAIIAVFVAGLMVGRTPEYLGKKIRAREIKLASLYILATPTLVLVGTAIALAMPGQRAAMLNPGPHGLSEVLYAFASAGNNNGSAFAGISVNTEWYNTALGLVMLLARFLPIIVVLALAGSLARQTPVPVTAGTLPTHRPLFVGLLIGVVLIVSALTYFPALALGPLAEGLR
jgi:K+-transporting ATPase ATPase A chain